MFENIRAELYALLPDALFIINAFSKYALLITLSIVTTVPIKSTPVSSYYIHSKLK